MPVDQTVQREKPQLIDAQGVLRAHAYVVWHLKRLTIDAIKELADETGISWRTLQKIRSGESADPGVGNIEKLANHIKRENVRGLGQS